LAILTLISNQIAGFSWKAAAATVSTTNITLSGEQTISGVLTSASRVLVAGQTSQPANGLYVSAAGAWTRTTDADAGSELINATVLITGGTHAGEHWNQVTPGPITLGTTNIVFNQVNVGGVTYSADETTLHLGGTVFSIKDVELLAIAGLTSAADSAPYFTGSGTAALMTVTSFARTFLDDTTQGAVQTTLGLVPGTNVQAFDAELAAIAGLVSAANKIIVFTGSGTAALASYTPAGFSLTLSANATVGGVNTGDQTTFAWSGVTGTPTTLLGYGITNAQPLHANLTSLAGIAGVADLGFYFSAAGTLATNTITAAARTVLDDTTPDAMLTTLGGAAFTGTGGVARATSPIFVTPQLGTPASGVLTNCTGTAAGLTAGNATLAATVTTNANLTGDVTSVGNAATIPTTVISAAARTVTDDATVAAMVDTLGGAASTGTGGLARATSPTFVTPALGTPASGVLTNCTGTASGLTAGNATTAGTCTGNAATATLATNTVANATDPGTITIGTGQVRRQYQQLVLTGAERLTMQGTARLVAYDQVAAPTVYLGTPKVPRGPFTVPTDYFLEVLSRLSLAGSQRATLEGTASLYVDDPALVGSRLVLAGRG
jgi:hypothetical protein